MRVRRGSSFEETLEDLNYLERTSFEKVLKARSKVEEVTSESDKAQVRLRKQIREALANGVPAALIAHHLGLTVGRVYQIKMDYQPNREKAAS